MFAVGRLAPRIPDGECILTVRSEVEQGGWYMLGVNIIGERRDVITSAQCGGLMQCRRAAAMRPGRAERRTTMVESRDLQKLSAPPLKHVGGAGVSRSQSPRCRAVGRGPDRSQKRFTNSAQQQRLAVCQDWGTLDLSVRHILCLLCLGPCPAAPMRARYVACRVPLPRSSIARIARGHVLVCTRPHMPHSKSCPVITAPLQLADTHVRLARSRRGTRSGCTDQCRTAYIHARIGGDLASTRDVHCDRAIPHLTIGASWLRCFRRL